MAKTPTKNQIAQGLGLGTKEVTPQEKLENTDVQSATAVSGVEFRNPTPARTVAHPMYEQPIDDEIRDMFKQIDAKGKYSYDLVRDLANVYSQVQYGEDPERALINPVNWDLQDERGGNNPRTVEEVMQYHVNVQKFCCDVDFRKYSGRSPLEKACNVVYALSSMEKKKKQQKQQQQQPQGQQGQQGEGEGEGEEQDDMPETRATPQKQQGGDSGQEPEIFQDSNCTGTSLNDEMDRVNSVSDFAKECLGKKNRSSENLLHELSKEHKKLLELGSKMKQLSRLNTTGKVTKERDPHGRKTRTILMEELAQLPQAQKFNFGFPKAYLTYKAVQKSMHLRERVSAKHHKQLLYMLIDCSGSMNQKDKLLRVLAVLLNRLEGVASGEAELYARFYESDLYPEHHITSYADAVKFFGLVRDYPYNQGGTEIGNCLGKVITRMHEFPGMVNPNVMIVTDGQDSVRDMDCGKATVHTYLVEKGLENHGLKRLCDKTRGVYLKTE